MALESFRSLPESIKIVRIQNEGNISSGKERFLPHFPTYKFAYTGGPFRRKDFLRSAAFSKSSIILKNGSP
jgi:hypothetical protein